MFISFVISDARWLGAAFTQLLFGISLPKKDRPFYNIWWRQRDRMIEFIFIIQILPILMGKFKIFSIFTTMMPQLWNWFRSYLIWILRESNLEFVRYPFFVWKKIQPKKGRKFDAFRKLLLPALKRERPGLPISGV